MTNLNLSPSRQARGRINNVCEADRIINGELVCAMEKGDAMSEKKELSLGASECFMCQQYRPQGCLECRTHRLLSDIRSGLYDKMGTEQNRAEWEERALKAEAELDKAEARIKVLEFGISEFFDIMNDGPDDSDIAHAGRKLREALTPPPAQPIREVTP